MDHPFVCVDSVWHDVHSMAVEGTTASCIISVNLSAGITNMAVANNQVRWHATFPTNEELSIFRGLSCIEAGSYQSIPGRSGPTHAFPLIYTGSVWTIWVLKTVLDTSISSQKWPLGCVC